MKSIRASLPFAFGIGALTILLGGCTIKWQVVQDPYANYHRIEQRVQFQLSEINSSVQNGNLWAPMAQVLSENDDMIRQLAWHYQGGQAVDLTPQQAAYLDSLLNDNAAAINDALTRRDQWAQAFEGNWDFSYASYQDRALYIAYLHYQLDRQQAIIDEAYQSGTLTGSQAQDLRTRIQVIRNSETGCYNNNGHLDLTQNQIHHLQQMADDNNRFIRFRTHRQRGRWQGDHYSGWTGQRREYTNNPWLNNRPPDDGSNQGQTNHARYWDGRPFQRQAPPPTPTPMPYRAAVPTATPVPFHAALPTATPVPHYAAAPTATSHPATQAQPTVVDLLHPNHPDHPVRTENPKNGSNFLGQVSNILLKPPTKVPTHAPAAVPTDTPQPVAAAPTSTPVPAQPASAPSTALSTPSQSDNNSSSDDSDNSGNGDSGHPHHPGHPDHPGHPNNGGNDDNSQGSNQGN